MPKKKAPKRKKSELRSAVNKYLHEFFTYLLSLLEENTGSLIKKVTDLMTLKERIKKHAIALALMLAALIIILSGLSIYIDSLFPSWPSGLSHIVVGTFIIIMASYYRKS